jgi:hypothetical protein
MKRRDQRHVELPLELMDVWLVDEADLVAAENLIAGCVSCSEAAHLPLDYVLDAVTALDPLTTEVSVHQDRPDAPGVLLHLRKRRRSV